MDKINKDYIKNMLSSPDDNLVKEVYDKFAAYVDDDQEIIELLENIYYGYIGYCEEENIPYQEYNFLNELASSCDDMIARFKKITYLMDNPDETDVIRFRVTLRGYEKLCYRILEITNIERLSDLANLILASFKAIGGYPYYFKIEEIPVYSVNSPDAFNKVFATDLFLVDLNLERNSRLSLFYDPKIEWIFDIEILNIEKNHSDEITNLVDGAGFGILEDDKEFFNYLITNDFTNAEDFANQPEVKIAIEELKFYEFDIEKEQKKLSEMAYFIGLLYDDNFDDSDEENEDEESVDNDDDL